MVSLSPLMVEPSEKLLFMKRTYAVPGISLLVNPKFNTRRVRVLTPDSVRSGTSVSAGREALGVIQLGPPPDGISLEADVAFLVTSAHNT